MRHAFVFEGTAVLVGPWHEPMDPPERGARIEVRLLEPQPWRGSPFAAQRIVVDDPIFRADLFDRMDQPPGALGSAHFHPSFTGVEPCTRQWPEAIKADPTAWLTRELGNLPGLLARAGVDVTGLDWLDTDAAAMRDAAHAIVDAVEAVWAEVRSEAPALP